MDYDNNYFPYWEDRQQRPMVCFPVTGQGSGPYQGGSKGQIYMSGGKKQSVVCYPIPSYLYGHGGSGHPSSSGGGQSGQSGGGQSSSGGPHSQGGQTQAPSGGLPNIPGLPGMFHYGGTSGQGGSSGGSSQSGGTQGAGMYPGMPNLPYFGGGQGGGGTAGSGGMQGQSSQQRLDPYYNYYIYPYGYYG